MVVMAQPLKEGFPALLLCAFGTNNQFKTKDVENRLRTILKTLEEEGIDVLTFVF